MPDPDVPPQVPPLPTGLPAPVDDGAADHLTGLRVPPLSLPSTDGVEVDLAELAADRLVLYVFPRMGRPDVADPDGWDAIPGARGCTQQSCAFRDLNTHFAGRGFIVAGLSAQSPEDQSEAAARLHLAFRLLADPQLRAGETLRLPTWTMAGVPLYKRLTLVACNGEIVKVFYPVFPPDENAREVLDWIVKKEMRPPRRNRRL